MRRYEYKLVPAPQRATKHKGLKGAELFAATLQDTLNALGQEGWEYQRTDTLPEEVRTGLTARSLTQRHMLVFRRPLPEPVTRPAPQQTAAPQDSADTPGSLANLFLNGADDDGGTQRG